MNYTHFTSESVCAGHPDKICDQISDAILDKAIKIDPFSRVAVETLVTKNHITIAGEVTCPKKINYKLITRRVIKNLGYTNSLFGFSHHSPINILIHQQSPDISTGVDTGGAGDQGMMFGYACRETPELMPLPITLAHRLVEKIDKLRKTSLPYLRPDGKSEVRIRYEKTKPIAVEKIVIAVPHDPKVKTNQVKKDLYQKAVIPVLKKYKFKPPGLKHFILNGTGKWEIGGPASDTGVTGRKIIVDTYGGMGRVGGGCFSGKDVSKVDRSAAYGARFIAKNIISAKLADRCEIQIAYVIGKKLPICRSIETFGTAKKSQKIINSFAWELLDMSTESIINTLNLRQPIYEKTASYGHFGRHQFPWEKIIV